MKREKALSCLVAMVLSVCLGFGGVACMVTGLKLDADLVGLGIGCVVVAAAVSLGFCFGRSKVVWGVVGAVCGFLALNPDFSSQVGSMLADILHYYHMGYGLVIPEWLQNIKGNHSHMLPLLMVAGVVMALTAWTMLRRKSVILAVAIALLPLTACLVVTDTVPSNFAIFILLFGLTLLVMTSAARRRNGDGDRLAAILALPVAAALLALLVMMPRTDFQGPSGPANLDSLLNWFTAKLPTFDQTFEGEPVFSFGSTADQRVKLSELGKNEMAKTPVMEVTSERGGKLYLRGRSYDVYDGKGWTATTDRVDTLSPFDEEYTTSPFDVSVKMLTKRGQYYLPCYPDESQSLSGGMLPNPEYDMEYSFRCRELESDWIYHWGGSFTDGGTTSYLKLPDQTRQWAQALLTELKVPSYVWSNPVVSLEKIERYVSKSAAYDLMTDRMPAAETDFAKWFLEQSDTGYCVHFATAATVLLRAAGIPARYVEGYTVEVAGSDTTVVRENHAHAWVEYYMPGIGWVIMDPTPADHSAPDETEPPATTENTEPSTEATTQPSTETTKPSTDTRPTGPSGGESTEPSAPGMEEKKELPKWIGTVLLWFAGIAAAVAAVVGQWMLRRRHKWRRMHSGKPNTQALARFREVKRMAKLRSVEVPDQLEELAEKARFSQHTLTKEELAAFDTFLRESEQTLKQRPWYLSLIYRLVYAAY